MLIDTTPPHPPPTGSDPVSLKHPFINLGLTPCPQTWVLKSGQCSGSKAVSHLCVVRWTQPPCRTPLHHNFFTKGCGWRSECQTKGRSVIDLPIIEGCYDFHISLVFITKLFSPEKLPNRHIIHACSGLPVGLSCSIRASNALDPIGLGPCGDFREGMLFFLRTLAARLPQYRPTQYQSQLLQY